MPSYLTRRKLINKMLTNIFYLLTYFISQIVSVYSLSFNDIDGNNVSFSSFSGKKILIVNTATQSSYTPQLTSLENLYQRHKDSLVIIAFPSNDFGKEPRTNAEIKSFIDSAYNVHFLLGAKINVSGASVSPVFNWLLNGSMNGTMNGQVTGNFTKYLINKDGKLIGVFASQIDPLSPEIEAAIQN